MTHYTRHGGFLPNTFRSVKGSYSGRIEAVGAHPSYQGSFKITLTGMGRFTGKVRLGKLRLPVSGEFANDGSFSLSIDRPGAKPVSLSSQLNVAANPPQITGTVAYREIVSTLTGNR